MERCSTKLYWPLEGHSAPLTLPAAGACGCFLSPHPCLEEIKDFLFFCCSLFYDSLLVSFVCNVQYSWSIGTKFLGFVMDELMLIEARSSLSDEWLGGRMVHVRTDAQMSQLPPCIWKDRLVILDFIQFTIYIFCSWRLKVLSSKMLIFIPGSNLATLHGLYSLTDPQTIAHLCLH